MEYIELRICGHLTFKVCFALSLAKMRVQEQILYILKYETWLLTGILDDYLHVCFELHIARNDGN